MEENMLNKDDVLERLRADGFRKVYADLEGQKPGGGEWVSCRCPFHDDENPSGAYSQETGYFRCHAGCTGGKTISAFDFWCRENGGTFSDAVEALGALVGLSGKEARTTPGRVTLSPGCRKPTRRKASTPPPPPPPPPPPAPAQAEPPLTVERYAKEKHLDPATLREVFHLRDGKNGLEIPYDDIGDNPPGRTRIRLSMGGERRFLWAKGDAPCIPYGLWTGVENARELGRLILVEGESDTHALYALGFTNAIGLPGASMTGKLEAAHVEAIPEVAIHREPDDAGEGFVVGCVGRLQALGYAGRVRLFSCSDLDGNPKDPSDALRMHGVDEGARLVLELIDRADDAAPAGADEPDEADIPDDAPAPLRAEAFHGLLGEAVGICRPYTEACDEAILLQLLAGVGAVADRIRYVTVGATRQAPNVFVVIVGASSRARKGSALGFANLVLDSVDPGFTEERRISGLTTGEGLIHQCRDANKEIGDAGVSDKRTLVVESEFARPLQAMKRDGNTLSAILRKAWDGDTLDTLTKVSPLKARGAHVAMIGHITVTELGRVLTSTDRANGLANRILFAYVDRARLLPDGPALPESDRARLHEIGLRIRDNVNMVPAGEVALDDEARALRRAAYPELSRSRPGGLDDLLTRLEAQILRVALVYALVDGSPTIRAAHWQAARAVIDYVEASTAYIFKGSVEDPVGGEILEALRRKGSLSKTEISKLFSGHRRKREIDIALTGLVEAGLACPVKMPTKGKAKTVYSVAT